MKQRKWRIAADVPMAIKSMLIQLYQPRFSQLYLFSLTWAYGVESDYGFDDHVQDCTLYALHTSVSTQAFAANLGGSRHRPDGKTLHVTYCTFPEVKPADAGLFDPSEAVPIKPLTFPTRLMLRPVWEMKPTTVRVG